DWPSAACMVLLTNWRPEIRCGGASMNRSQVLHTRYRVLATDGDGTLTRGGKLGETTRRALERWRRTGRKLILTTGETPQDLAKFPFLILFDLVVAENGALLFDPKTKK